MKTYGVDVSEYQGVVDFTRIYNEGFGFAFIKASGSSSPDKGPFYRDPSFTRNRQLLDQTPMVKGLYHYLSPRNPRTQAALLYETWEDVGAEWAPIVDIEDDHLSALHVNRFLEAWYVLNKGGLKGLVVYTRREFWKEHVGMSLNEDVILWDAHWVPTPARHDDAHPYASQQAHYIGPDWMVGYAGMTLTILQFTDHALVDGKYMDASVFYGSVPELRERLGVV